MESKPTTGAVNKKVYIGAIVALLLINVFTIYLYESTDKDRSEITTQKTALQNDFKNLSDTLDVKRYQLEQFKGKNAELDKAIAEKQDMIDQEKKQIASLFAQNKLTAGELSRAKGMIAQYQASIADMTTQITNLTAQNEQLNNDKTQLTADLGTERQTTSQLSEQNKTLSHKVEVGSMLQIARVDVEAIKNRPVLGEGRAKRAKATDDLKITFETGANKVLDKGPVSLYVRIINPKGETISVADQGSGTITAAETATPIQYSTKKDLDWDQTNKKVVLYWNQHISDPGVYKVEVYQNGYVVGQGAVKLS